MGGSGRSIGAPPLTAGAPLPPQTLSAEGHTVATAALVSQQPPFHVDSKLSAEVRTASAARRRETRLTRARPVFATGGGSGWVGATGVSALPCAVEWELP